MNKAKGLQSLASRNLTVGVAAVVLTVALATIGLARPAGHPPQGAAVQGNVLGIAFDGHQVSNLENSIKFYEALDFHLQGKATDWKVDDVANKLGGTKGAESRTAVMIAQSSVSDKQFPLILREYRGIERKDWSGLSSSDLLSGHMDLTVQGDCTPSMDKLKAINLLKQPNMNLPGGGGQQNGPRRFVFVQDPDGWFIELFAIMPPAPGAPPPPAPVSNSSATNANIDRLGIQPGFNHIGLNIVDPKKALAFYQGVLGGDYPPLAPPPAAPATPPVTPPPPAGGGAPPPAGGGGVTGGVAGAAGGGASGG